MCKVNKEKNVHIWKLKSSVQLQYIVQRVWSKGYNTLLKFHTHKIFNTKKCILKMHTQMWNKKQELPRIRRGMGLGKLIVRELGSNGTSKVVVLVKTWPTLRGEGERGSVLYQLCKEVFSSYSKWIN